MAIMKINGINLRYDVMGDGPALLFIHGLGSCSEDWDAQVPEFAKQYKVITFDVRGHGNSEKPAGAYSIPMFAADAAALLKALGVTSAHVVGVSMGGAIAFQLTVDSPSLVKSLTIVNSAPEMLFNTFRQKMVIWQRLLIVRMMGLVKMAEVIGPKLFPTPEHAHMQAVFTERFKRNEKGPYLASMRALVGWGVTDRLGTIKCPTLIIAADQDYTPVSLKEDYVKKIPGGQLVVVPNSRHALPMEWPDKFNAVLMKFLKEHP